ncbi:CobW/HypB/UreG, nucleotide-binding domain [Sporobacter termitidis DSM 10068]|uniref:CobW/HypB/UreG, nucleotide-binding domain n=1 Tax=Sporobacter termitidis DSM 10068 TaxID=1123282 RepID=A0A1M5WK88_9FIRM|nr:GTP-binding protein [Sporobacter termitidis]SHH87925.1 CobW/HypB/UreG, nucleotide-binding domain [Sporobacter termitidis DSM 10068]
MKRFMVVSGFLGAGKTTSMVALADYINANTGKASVIANDLGAKNLVDAKFSEACGCNITELTGECICYQTENLVDRLRRLMDYEHNDLVMSDIPGCGVGALDHVYHKLDREYHGEFELAPFTVIADPERLRTIMPERADINLPEEMNYLFRAQLQEADVVVLNKIDLLSDADAETYLKFLRDFCPGAEVFAVSAKNKTNIDKVADYIMTHDAQLKTIDIGYGGPSFIAAEQKLSWYNCQLYVKICCGTFDGNAFLGDLVEAIRTKLKDKHRNIPHLKVYADGTDGTACKISLLGVDYDMQFDSRLGQPCADLPVIINARAACESQLLAEIMDEALDETAKKYNLDAVVFFTECFGMMDEGRI